MLKLYTPNDQRRLNLVSADDILKTCRAAAKLAMQGDAWSAEDRADCAAHLTGLVLGRAALDPETVKHHHGNLYPARLIGLDFLVKRAGNWRDAEVSRRERDAIDANDRGPMQVHGSTTGENGDANNVIPWQARRTALHLLQNAGLLGRRIEDAPHLWSMAYSAARSSAGLESREVAEELGISFGTLRNHLSRAAKDLAQYGKRDAWLDALCAEGIGWTRPGEYVAPKDRTRLKPEQHAPVQVTRDAPEPRDGSAWSAPVQSSASRAGWTVDPLPANTRARLDKAARMRRTRAAAKSPADVRRARLAAGLPAEVR